MSDEDKRSERVREWAKYSMKGAKCRIESCGYGAVSETPEGDLCLDHYISLPSCVECGKAASGGTVVAPVCYECQGKRADYMPLMSSSLSYHDEVPGHDTINRSMRGKGLTYLRKKVLGQGEFKGVDLLIGKR